MKRATRRAIEKWIVPGILGGVVGGIVGGMARDGEWFPLTVMQMRVLVAGGVILMALTIYDLWRSDEMERQVYFVAMTAAFVGTGVVTLVCGLLQLMGYPVLNWALVTPVMIGFYSVGWWGAWLRYR